MTTGSATAPDLAGPVRWHDLIPGLDFTLSTVAALFDSTAGARTAIETALAEGVLAPLDQRSADDVPRYRVTASHSTLDLHLPTDHEHPAVLRMLEMLLRKLVGVDDRLNPGGYRSADLDELGDIPTFADDAAAVRWFTAEFAMIIAAQHLAAAMGKDLLVRQFGEISWAATTVTGRVPEAMPVQTLAAEAAERLDHPAAGIPRARVCWALLKLGRRTEALAAAGYAWNLAERHGHACSRATAQHALGDAYFALRRYKKALTSYRIAREVDGKQRVVLAADLSTTPLLLASIGSRWVAIAATHLAMGWPGAAVQAAAVAVACIGKDPDQPRALAQARAMLAQALLAHNRAADAIPVLTLAAAALDPAIDQHALAHVGELLGEAALATGTSTTATEHFRAAAVLFEQIGWTDHARALRDRAGADTPVTGPLPAHHDEVRT